MQRNTWQNLNIDHIVMLSKVPRNFEHLTPKSRNLVKKEQQESFLVKHLSQEGEIAPKISKIDFSVQITCLNAVIMVLKIDLDLNI